MRLYSVFILVLLIATGCHTRGPQFDPYETKTAGAEGQFATVSLTNRLDNALLKPPTEPYRLGPGDVIEIETIGDGAGHSTVTVGPDGKVYYSLLPGTSLWGLSLAEARALLQREMAKYARATPEMVINLRGVGSQRVWLLGSVRSPGVYPLSTPVTLLGALAGAGGVPVNAADDGADLSRSFVLRNGKLLPVDFARLLKQGDLSQNIYLAPDDFVFLRPVEAPNVYVLGAVNTPNSIPYSRDMSVAGAILSAGGTAKYALQNKVVIIRGGLTQPQITELNYKAIVTGQARNVLLQPGDIVYVPFIPFRHLAQLVEEILDEFVRTVAVNQAIYIGNGGIEQPAQVQFGISPPVK